MGDETTSVVDDLWVVLAVECADVLNSLVRLQRKQFSPDAEAAELGVPSIGMVAFLLAAGEAGLTAAAFAEMVGADARAKTRLASIERVLQDQVDGTRRLHPEQVQAIADAAGLAPDTARRLTERMRDEYPAGRPWCKAAISTMHVVEAVRTRRQRAAQASASVVVTSIGAALRLWYEGQDLQHIEAELHGVVVHRKKVPNAMVLLLSDGLDSINLIANRNSQGAVVTSACADQDRIRITGRLGPNSKGVPSVFVETCERLVEGDMIVPEKRQLLNDLKRRGLPPRVLLGTVVQEVDALLWERRFTRFEPSIVSSALALGDTVEPLDLYFPGLGARTNLVPSPAPQLIRAGIGLGIPKLYATSRIITRTIRDGFTSPDSPATFLFLLNADEDRTLRTVEELLWSLLERLLTDSGRRSLAPEPPWDEIWDDARSPESPHHCLQRPRSSPRGFDVTPFSTMINSLPVVEGHVAHISGSLKYAILSVQEERLLQLFATGDGNRLVRFQGPESVLIPGVSL